MAIGSGTYASELRRELAARNREWARGRAHVESLGGDPVIVYAPERECHGNFFEPAFKAILERPEWAKRLNKVHAQGRALPRLVDDPKRKWRELDSCMSSDALLMNVFCTPGVVESPAVRRMLGVDAAEAPVFGWKAKVPLQSGLFDRTEVDMFWGELATPQTNTSLFHPSKPTPGLPGNREWGTTFLVEAKLTEADFQTRKAEIVEAYRDFDLIFDRDLLPQIEVVITRRRAPVEMHEDFTQEWEDTSGLTSNETAAVAEEYQAGLVAAAEETAPREVRYAGYQLIRNVLAAHAAGASFCVIHDERRPDLREAWFEVMRAVKSAVMRTRLKVLTWQELTAVLPDYLQPFLEIKYGIVAADKQSSRVGSSQ